MQHNSIFHKWLGISVERKQQPSQFDKYQKAGCWHVWSLNFPTFCRLGVPPWWCRPLQQTKYSKLWMPRMPRICLSILTNHQTASLTWLYKRLEYACVLLRKVHSDLVILYWNTGFSVCQHLQNTQKISGHVSQTVWCGYKVGNLRMKICLSCKINKMLNLNSYCPVAEEKQVRY